MKALVQKDFYVIWKQMRMLVLVLALLSMVNSAFNTVFLVVWCSMLPYTGPWPMTSGAIGISWRP